MRRIISLTNLLLIYLVLLSSNQGFAQQVPFNLSGPKYVCGNTVHAYSIPNINSECSYDGVTWQMTAGSSGGTITPGNIDETQATINWNNSLTSATVRATLNAAVIQCNQTVYTLNVYQKILTSITLTASSSTEPPGYPANSPITITPVFHGDHTSNFPKSTIEWSIYDTNPDTLLVYLGSGSSLSFTPDSFRTELANHYNSGTNVLVKARYIACGQLKEGTTTLALTKAPPIITGISFVNETCPNSNDGQVIISGVDYNFSSGESLRVAVSNFGYDAEGNLIPLGTHYAKGTISNSNGTTITGLPPSVDSYAVLVEVVLANGLPFGLHDIKIVDIAPAPAINNTSSSPNNIVCHNGTTTITPSATDGTGSLSFSTTGPSGWSGDLNTCGPGNYTVRATDSNGCHVDKGITIDNPLEITIAPETTQPSQCVDNSGDNTEFGQIIVTASNYYLDPKFSITKNNVAYVTTPGEPSVSSREYNVLEPGDYNITVTTDECSNEIASTGSIEILPLKRPSVLYADITVVDPSCPNGNGTITLTKFRYNNVDYYSSSNNLGDFKFYNGNTPIPAGNEPSFFSFAAAPTSKTNYNFKIEHWATRCPVIFHTTISARLQVAINTPTVKESCLDKYNGTITISSSEGNSASMLRQYTISPAHSSKSTVQINDGRPAFFGTLHAGVNYTITVDDFCPYGNNTSTISRPVGSYNRPSADISAVQIECHNQENGQLIVTPSGASGNSPGYTITLLPNNNVFSNVAEDTLRTFKGLNHIETYTIKIDDSNECTEIFNDLPPIINPPPLQITSTVADITHVTCWNGSDAVIPVVAQGGTGQISFSLDNTIFTDGIFNNPDYSHTFSGLSAGEHTVYLKDINACPLSQTYTIIQPDEYKIIDFTIDGTKCYGGADGGLSIQATGGTPNGTDYIYHLMDENNNNINSITGQTAIFTGLSFGNYYVNIYDSRNCLLTSNTGLLNQPDEMVITKSMTSASCFDSENITLTANVTGGTGLYTYTWKDINNTVIGNADTINVLLGNYFVGVVDANNCGYGRTAVGFPSFQLPFVAERPDTLKLSIDNQQDVDYNGLSNASVSLISVGGWSFHQYSKDGISFQNSPEFNGLPVGQHTFFVKDGSNCQNSITTTIVQPDPFIISLNSKKDVNCFDGTDGQIIINAEGGIQPYTYTLDDGQGNIITGDYNHFDNLSTGNYTVNVGYKTYTHTLDNIFVSQPVSALSSAISDYQSPRCTFSDGWATVSTSGGTVPYSYSWNNLQTTATATNLRSGDYYVAVSDFNNCTDTAWISLFDIAGPELTIDNIDNFPCFDSENVGSITLNVLGGTEPYDIKWDDINQQTGATASGLTIGSYSATVTDKDGCISQLAEIPITRPEELLAVFDDFKDPACYNEANGEITASGTGGTAPYQFNWQNVSNAGNTGIVSDLPAGKYYLQLTDDHNCLSTDSFELKNPDEIIINLPDSVFICNGQTATLDAGNKGSFYQWSSDNSFSSDKQIVNLQDEGDYSVVVSNVQGCSNSKNVHIKYENRQLDAAFLLASEATMLDTIVLIEISWPIPDSLEWSLPDDLMRLTDGEAYKELLPLQTGEYTVGMKAYLAGCEDIVEKTITIVPAADQKTLKEEVVAIIQSARLFPNPNTGNFEVEVKLAYETDIRADVFSMKGTRIMPTKYESGKKEYVLSFNLMKLEPGVYFVNINAKNEMRKLKFVVN